MQLSTSKHLPKTNISNLEDFPKDFANKKFASPSLVIGDIVKYHKNYRLGRKLEGLYFKKLEARYIIYKN